MAQIKKPTPEQEAGWKEWVAGRPDNVREVAERFNPWTLYRMKSTGQRVSICSFGEGEKGDVTLTVDIVGQFNLLLHDLQVFGIDPDDLEECDLPAEDEPLGEILDDDEQLEYINARRRENGLPPLDQ